MNVVKAKKALEQFCEDIEATGGITRNSDKSGPTWIVIADQDWTDLADTYLLACEALNHKPMIDREGGEQ